LDKGFRKGLLFGTSAYCIWGVLPIYWKLLSFITPFEILANRFIHSFIFVGILILCMGKGKVFISEFKFIITSKKRLLAWIAASVMITINWGVYIWAVNSGHILSTSMGYYINPLVSVIFGIIFLRERLDIWQLTAVILSAIGVMSMIWQIGQFPWISILIAMSFAIYGLIKKILPVSAITSIMLESALILPFMLFYEYYLSIDGNSIYQTISFHHLLLLLLSGIATATPLLLFTAGAKILPLKVMGFLQYFSPTITLLIGIFIYKEDFTSAHLLAFGLIWIGLAIFSISQIKKQT